MKFDTTLQINIENFILSKRTLPKQQIEYLEVIFTNNTNENIDLNKLTFPFATSNVKSCKIKTAQILDKNDDEKEIVEITLENNESTNFLPGDTIGILPENDNEEVEYMLKVLNLLEKADIPCMIQVKPDTSKKGAKIPPHILSNGITCREILTHFLNFKSIPKKVFLCSLLDYCENENEKHFLETLCSKEGSELYNDLILKKPLYVLDIFKICQSIHPPISLLIENLPRLLPRPYSISNYHKNNSDEIKIIFSYLLNKPGITTNYMRKKVNNIINNCDNLNNNINLYFRQSNKFRLLDEYYSKNIIMISIGCGISPFLSFLEYKKYLIENGQIEFGSWYLYSGFKCKNCAIYRNELIEYEKNGILEKYYECFSRDSNSKYNYVQDAINQTQNDFNSLMLNDNTILFVCADGNTISKDIKLCVQKYVFGNVDDDSNRIVDEWIKKGKYIEDIWI